MISVLVDKRNTNDLSHKLPAQLELLYSLFKDIFSLLIKNGMRALTFYYMVPSLLDFHSVVLICILVDPLG